VNRRSLLRHTEPAKARTLLHTYVQTYLTYLISWQMSLKHTEDLWWHNHETVSWFCSMPQEPIDGNWCFLDAITLAFQCDNPRNRAPACCLT